MWSWPGRSGCFFRRTVQFPLAEIVPGAIEYNDTEIVSALPFRMAVGDINIAIMWIECDFRHSEKLRRARIQGRTVHGAVRGIEHAALADLQQKLFSVVRIFLHDAVLGPVEPHMAVAADRAAVEIL